MPKFFAAEFAGGRRRRNSRMVCSTTCRWLVPFVLVLHLLAQERRPLTGRVLDHANQPVAAAVVHWTTTIAAHASVAPAEVLTTTTDATGRFRVEVLPGRGYAGGAVGPRSAAGEVAVTPLVVAAGSGEFLTLRLGRPAAPARVPVRGGQAWGAEAPTRLRFTLQHAPGLQAEVEIAADGMVPVPPLPADAMWVEFVTTPGETLAAAEVPLSAAPPTTLEVPAPRPLRVRVVDGNGNPAAGATIAMRTLLARSTSSGRYGASVREAWRTLGATDAAGRLDARIAPAADWLQVFTARRGGAATALAALVGDKPVDARHDANADAAELVFALADERPLDGRLLRSSNEPLVGATAWLEVTHLLPLPQGGSAQVPLLFPVVTDATGAWRASGLPAQFTTPRLLAPPGLPRPAGLQLPAILTEASGQVAALEPVVLAGLPTLDLQVLRADGGPAEGAAVLLVPLAPRRWFVEPWDAQHRLDRAGRARIGLRAGEALLFCTDGSSFAEQVVDETTGRLELRLEALPKSVWHITTADGKPAAGARLTLSRYSPPIDEQDPRRQARGAIAVTLHAAWIDGRCADDDGRIELYTIPDSRVPIEVAIEHPAGSLEQLRLTRGERELMLNKR